MSIDSRIDFIGSPLDLTTSTGSSTGAAVCTASVAAAGASIRNVAKRVQATVSVSSASIQVPIIIGLWNGTSAGTLLASWQVTPKAGSVAVTDLPSNPTVLDVDNLHIPGLANAVMTLGTNTAAGAGTLISCNLQSYAFPRTQTTYTFVS